MNGADLVLSQTPWGPIVWDTIYLAYGCHTVGGDTDDFPGAENSPKEAYLQL